MSDTTYNGGSNYGTCCVNLWLSKHEPTYKLVLGMVRTAVKDKNPVYTLSKSLKDMIEESNPITNASLYSDFLMNFIASLASVNFYEIAEHWINDYQEVDPDGQGMLSST